MAPQEPQFTLVRTDIAGFAGFAERGPLPEDFSGRHFDATDVVVKIASWNQFQATFGGFLSTGYLAYAVRAFFENGGSTCYVVRVASGASKDPASLPSAASLTLPDGPPSLLGKLGQLLSPFQVVFKPDKGIFPSVSDLVRLHASRGSLSQINQVVAVENGTLRFANALDPKIQPDATLDLFPAALTIVAASRGSWGNRLQIQVTPLDDGAFALRVGIYVGPESPLTEVEFYRRLTLTDSTATDYAITILESQSNLIRIPQIHVKNIVLNPKWDPQFASGQFYLRGGRDGLSQVTLGDFTGSADDRRGLRLLEEIDEIAMLAVPDAVYRGAKVPTPQPPTIDPCLEAPGVVAEEVPDDPTAVPQSLDENDSLKLQHAMIDQCVRLRYRVALIDAPDNLPILKIQDWPATKGLLTRASRYAAIYYPWLKVPNVPKTDSSTRRVPPSGHVAGAYAYNDLTFGVQRPPANIELGFITDVGQSVSDAQQGDLNESNINVIRAFPGRGIRIWGARSLASRDDSDWRFIHVRRLMSAIEETLERYSRWVVFRNNDRALRSSLKHSLEVMLQGIWARGGLKGGKPAQAFFVKCDETNNPPQVIDRGQLICQIGVAIAAPMEFIVFEIRQAAAGAQVVEE